MYVPLPVISMPLSTGPANVPDYSGGFSVNLRIKLNQEGQSDAWPWQKDQGGWPWTEESSCLLMPEKGGQGVSLEKEPSDANSLALAKYDFGSLLIVFIMLWIAILVRKLILEYNAHYEGQKRCTGQSDSALPSSVPTPSPGWDCSSQSVVCCAHVAYMSTKVHFVQSESSVTTLHFPPF